MPAAAIMTRPQINAQRGLGRRMKDAGAMAGAASALTIFSKDGTVASPVSAKPAFARSPNGRSSMVDAMSSTKCAIEFSQSPNMSIHCRVASS
jgi:hypothetical protein